MNLKKKAGVQKVLTSPFRHIERNWYEFKSRWLLFSTPLEL